MFPPFRKAGNPNFENLKKGGKSEKNWDGGNQKGGNIFKIKGGTLLFKLNLGIKRAKMGTLGYKVA